MSEQKNTEEWQKNGLEHVWLPYTQMKNAPAPLPVADAENTCIRLADGTTLIDGIASWWSSCHGYKHPHIVSVAKKQLDSLPHIMFAGFSHKPAYTLAKRLTDITPEGLNRVFFSDSGSIAVEVALKMSVQYWKNKGDSKRNKFICFKNGYHGDTMGGMSLSDPENGMHLAYNNFMPKQYVMDLPSDEYSFAEFETLVEAVSKNVAAIIIEPLVQCAGGMKFHSADVLAEIHRIGKKYGLIFIADEIATGFGRTGFMFACEEAGVSPDIMCIGKALTGGVMPLAATIASEEIFSEFLSDSLDTALMHGPTFMANPLACAAANASLDLFKKEPRLQQVEAIESQLRDELYPYHDLESVTDVRVKGAIGVVELKNKDWDYIFELRQKCIENGIWLRPFAGLIYIMPAFTISPSDLTKITKTIGKII